MLLKRDCDGRFAGGGQTCEPNGASLLLAEVCALRTSETCVPCDVAIALSGTFFTSVGGGLEGYSGWDVKEALRTYVAILCKFEV